MTVASNVSRWSYTGNGVTTAFAYTTRIFVKTDLDVYVDGTLKTVDTDYTVSGVDASGGGNVTFLSAPANAAVVVIVKDIPETQGSSLPLGGPFPSTIVEKMIDRLTFLVQQVSGRTDRVLRQTDSDATDIGTLPVKADRLGKFLYFDETTGDPEAVGAADIGSATEGAGIDITGNVVSLDIPVTVARGGTGATTASGARTALGLAIGTDVLAPAGSAAALTNKPATVAVTVVSDTTVLATGAPKRTFRMPFAMTLNAGHAGIRASVATTQSSGNIVTVDVNETGTGTILSTKLTIDNSEKTSTTAATAPVISDTSLADDAEITIDIDQIGDGTAKGLIVYLIGVRA